MKQIKMEKLCLWWLAEGQQPYLVSNPTWSLITMSLQNPQNVLFENS